MYCTEKNVQVLIALLKAHNIKKVIASPGTTNMTLVGSMQNDPWFEIYSSVDERSAAYMACGMAAESGEPVVLSCTGATASRNYYPGMSEAYYRKLPVLAVTSHQGPDRINQLNPQNLDRSVIAKDAALLSIQVPVVKDKRDEVFVTREINNALLTLRRNGGGPVHINIFTTYSNEFVVDKLPEVKVINRYNIWDEMPSMPNGTIAVFVGSHKKFSDGLTKAVDSFCACHNSVVFCDHTSGYYGNYKVLPAMRLQQKGLPYGFPEYDLIIHIGEVSAADYAGSIKCKEYWRVSEDGEIRDPYNKLTKIFQMPEIEFFKHYTSGESKSKEMYELCQSLIQPFYDKIPELPFCNVWSVSQLSKRLPAGSLLHISASNTRRCWNMFPLPSGVECVSNVGCCGIDGSTSALIGSSLASPKRLCFLYMGDLAFFYDMNSLGNRHIGNNIRILLVNNGIGAEFKLKPHRCYAYGDAADLFMAAGGHFGNKSKTLVRHYAEDLGFKYLTASNKDEYLHAMEEFVSTKNMDKPIIFEIFTDHQDEAEALELMKNLETDAKHKVKDTVRSILGEKGVRMFQQVVKK